MANLELSKPKPKTLEKVDPSPDKAALKQVLAEAPTGQKDAESEINLLRNLFEDARNSPAADLYATVQVAGLRAGVNDRMTAVIPKALSGSLSVDYAALGDKVWGDVPKTCAVADIDIWSGL